MSFMFRLKVLFLFFGRLCGRRGLIVITAFGLSPLQAQTNNFIYEPLDYYEVGGWVRPSPSPESVCRAYAALWQWDTNGHSADVVQMLPGLWKCQRSYKGVEEPNQYTYIKGRCQANEVPLSLLSGQYVTYPGYDQNIGRCTCGGDYIFDKDIEWCTRVAVVCSGPTCLGDPKDNGLTCRPGDLQPTCGNPIKPGDGNKVQSEVDYRDAFGSFDVRRTYNGSSFNSDRDVVRSFGVRWAQVYDSVLELSSGDLDHTCYRRVEMHKVICLRTTGMPDKEAVVVTVSRPDGKKYLFRQHGDSWENEANVNDWLVTDYHEDDSIIKGWEYISSQEGNIEYYGADGKLYSVAARTGPIQRLTYSDGTSNDTNDGKVPAAAPSCARVHPGSLLPAGRLLCVTDNWGRQLHFEYDEKGRVVRLITPAGQMYLYEYDGPSAGCIAGSSGRACLANNLTKIVYPEGTSKTYHYNETIHINGGSICPHSVPMGGGFGHLKNALTGITDENGVRFATWTYDCQGRATSSQHAGGVEKVSLAYGERDATGASTTTAIYAVGDPLAPSLVHRTFGFQTSLGVTKSTGIDLPCVGCGDAASRTYDANGNVSSRTDFNGVQTTYAYDLSRNLETKRVEGAGTAEARTVSTQWHAAYRLPLRMAEPLRITTNTYDGRGNLLSKSVQATSDATGASGFDTIASGTARTWRWTYNDVGQVLTATGPRTDVVDRTTYAYDDFGNLSSITNAAGHVTTLTDYDANGRVGRIENPNGTATGLAYSPRGWLVSKKVGSETTTYDYDGVGQLTRATQPDGSYVAYTYDDAHRLTGIADSLGNRIAYTLDAMGNRIREDVKDLDGQLARQTTRVYDALNRLQQTTGALQ